MILDKSKKKKTKRSMLKEITITEVSSVPCGANGGALVSLLKAAETKSEDGKRFPSSDYAYVPDRTKPPTWKLRLTSTPGGEPDARIVGAAVAALGPGFRGQKVQLPSDARAGVLSRVRRAWLAANPSKSREDFPSVLKSEEDTMEELQKELEELKASHKDLADKLARSEFRASLNDIQKAHYEGLEGDAKADFEKLSESDRETAARDAIAKAEAADDTVTVDGKEFRKSVIGDETFAILKAGEVEKAKLRKQLKAKEEEAIRKELIEKAGKEFPHLSGSPESIAKLYSLAKDDDSLMQVLKGADAHAESLSQESGVDSSASVNQEGLGAIGKLEHLAKAHAKENEITVEEAYSAVLDTDEGKRLYAESLKG